ncbi:hypothetical protein W822_09420 [Advenella kashmirensis W13003]|uniref:Transposase n=1 Tax=Advenella kashmirensis W13003 TaxID=1424334 RepID=V8QV29_9BURK|nr:hypothetical protein [Advenella kashmirensis]ETF03497.1 hypothetical protein W822_09420 [Advenella kashmirensis W13003]
MQVGTPLIAPDGYEILEKGISYYLLRSSRLTHQVLLLTFTPAPRLLAQLVMVDRDTFEHGLQEKLIMPTKATGLPPHLAGFEGFNFETVDMHRLNAKRSHRERVQERLLAIAPLLAREADILNSPSPEREINKYAENNGKNSQRLRTWFFTYLCFGRNIWSLMPTFFHNGQWDRLKRTEGKKFGRPSQVAGTQAGTRLTEALTQRIIRSYTKRAQPGHRFVSIYREAMVQDFEALVTTDERGRKRLISSGTIAIPSYDQYRYCVHKHIGIRQVQQSLYGDARYRRQYAQHQGAFARAVSNLYEKVEADGYYTADCPKGYVDGAQLNPLCVVRSVDTASGMRIGIGFAFGKEKSEAYNAMLFSAAISKKKFCSLFGIEIEEYQWPSIGLPLHYITDRGPGVKREPGADGTAPVGLVIREVTVSGSGQSKALVESAQRRRTKLEGPGSKLLSDLSASEMARREIRRLLAENQSANTSARLTPDMIRSNVTANPLGVWDYLDSRGRNNAQSMSFDEAVRRYLKRIDVRINRSGAYIKHQLFNSPALQKTGFLDRVGSASSQTVSAYILPFALRYIWLEIDGMLIEVKAQLPLRDDPEQLDRSYDELLQEDTQLKRMQAEQRIHSHAATAEQIAHHEHETGKKWRASRRVSTRRSQAKLARADARDAQTLLEGEAYYA